jgi:hypothetical protein
VLEVAVEWVEISYGGEEHLVGQAGEAERRLNERGELRLVGLELGWQRRIARPGFPLGPVILPVVRVKGVYRASTLSMQTTESSRVWLGHGSWPGKPT